MPDDSSETEKTENSSNETDGESVSRRQLLNDHGGGLVVKHAMPILPAMAHVLGTAMTHLLGAAMMHVLAVAMASVLCAAEGCNFFKPMESGSGLWYDSGLWCDSGIGCDSGLGCDALRQSPELMPFSSLSPLLTANEMGLPSVCSASSLLQSSLLAVNKVGLPNVCSVSSLMLVNGGDPVGSKQCYYLNETALAPVSLVNMMASRKASVYDAISGEAVVLLAQFLYG
eukprot:505491-Pelagomonas_calceolata.AAC.2